MSNMDAHNCGACGYDGGVNHHKEVAELNKQIAVLRAHNKASGEAKLVFSAIVFIVSCITGGIAWDSYVSPAPQITKVEKHVHTDPLSSAYKELGSAYAKCLDEGMDSLDRQNCNVTFTDAQNKLYELLEKRRKESVNGNLVHE